MKADDPIHLHNRHTGGDEIEKVYGEAWLKRIYGNPLGQLTLHAAAKRSFVSKLYGWAADRPGSAKRVKPFIRDFGLDVNEFADPDPDSYKTFNEFFYRKLKPSARPVDPRPEMAVLPADGRHLGFQDASSVKGIFAKGQTFDIPALVGDRALVTYERTLASGLGKFSEFFGNYFGFMLPNTDSLVTGDFIDDNLIQDFTISGGPTP